MTEGNCVRGYTPGCGRVSHPLTERADATTRALEAKNAMLCGAPERQTKGRRNV